MAFVLFTNEITPFYKFDKIECCQQYGKLKSSVSLTGFKSTLIVCTLTINTIYNNETSI